MYKHIPLILLLAFLAPVTAHAWESTMSCGPGIVECRPGNSPVPTKWRDQCAGFHLNETGTKQMDFASIQSIVRKSLAQWSSHQCSYLKLLFLGLTNEDRIGFNPYTNDNANIIIFRDDAWGESRSIMALTTVTQNSTTGEIYDADIELNSFHYKFSTDATGSTDQVDLENTLTHEFGHALGLAHSQVQEATMFGFSAAGDTAKRSLDNDDIAGLCSIYSVESILSSAKCRAKEGYYKKPKLDMDESPDEGCTCSMRRQSTHSSWFFLILGSLLIFVTGRVAYARRPKSRLSGKV